MAKVDKRINGRGNGWSKGLLLQPRPVRPKNPGGQQWAKGVLFETRKPVPPREGPLWEIFLEWFKNQNEVEMKDRSNAWRGFYAAYMLKDLFK